MLTQQIVWSVLCDFSIAKSTYIKIDPINLIFPIFFIIVWFHFFCLLFNLVSGNRFACDSNDVTGCFLYEWILHITSRVHRPHVDLQRATNTPNQLLVPNFDRKANGNAQRYDGIRWKYDIILGSLRMALAWWWCIGASSIANSICFSRCIYDSRIPSTKENRKGRDWRLHVNNICCIYSLYGARATTSTKCADVHYSNWQEKSQMQIKMKWFRHLRGMSRFQRETFRVSLPKFPN